MRKTLLITLDFPPMLGGVAVYYEEIMKRLPPNNVVVLVHNDIESQVYASDLSSKYKIIRRNFYTFPFFPKWLSLVRTIFSIIRKENIEFIQVGQVLPTGTVVYFLNKIIRIPYSVYTHAMDITVPKKSRWKRFLLRRILRNAEFVTTVSQYTKKELLKLGVKGEKIVLIPPCVDTDNFPTREELHITQIKKKYNILSEDNCLLTVARLVERKGIDVVLDALSLISEEGRFIQSITYIIIGEGTYRKVLEEKINKLILNDNIRVLLLGAEDFLTKCAFFSLADVFIMPSRELDNGDVEGFGIVFLEANLYKTPVIGGRSGGIPDAVLDSVNGFLVDPLDVNDVADKIIRLLQDKKLAIKLGRHGYQRVKNQFRWDEQAKKIENKLS